MTSCVFSLFFLVSLVSSFGAVDPSGLKIRVTDRARDVLTELALVFLEDLVNAPFPDATIKIGVFKVDVRGFTFTEMKVDPAQVSLDFQQDSGLHFEIRDLDFSVKLQRDVLLSFITDTRVDSRAATLTGSGVSAAITVKLNQNQQKRLNVEIPDDGTHCRVTADSINIKSSGFLGPLWDLLGPAVRFYFNNKLCPALQTFAVPKFNSVSERVTAVKVLHRLFNINIDYSLNGDVTVSSHSIDLPFKGLLWQGDSVDPGSVTGADPVFSRTDSMAYVGISESFFNSAATSVYKSGPFQLNITEFSQSDAGLQQLPKGRVQVNLTEAPVVSIDESGLSLGLNATVRSLTEASQPPVTANCHFDLMIDVEGNCLTLASRDIKCKVQTQRLGASVGFVTVEFFDKITNILTYWFGEGIPLPLPAGLNFNQGNVNFHNGFVVVGGSLNISRGVFEEAVNVLRKLF